MQVNTKTRIIIGASAYACIGYTINDADEFRCGTIDVKLPGGRGAPADLRRLADESREKAARHMRHAAVCEAAAIELDSLKVTA